LPTEEKTKTLGTKTKEYFDDIYKTHRSIQNEVNEW